MLVTPEMQPLVPSLAPRPHPVRVGLVSTYPPTRCGIGRFSSSLVNALGEDPSLDVAVVRLVSGPGGNVARGPVVMEIDPDNAVGVRAAGRLLGSCDVTIIQHEFGIYGEEDGTAVLDLVEAGDSPKIVVLHTVLPEPSDRQRFIIDRLTARSVAVVLCDSAAKLLHDVYALPNEPLRVIRHGAHWEAQPMNHQPRRQLVTWGLLGPGKGLERAIRAVAALRDLDPHVKYRIVGRTHPFVVERDGYRYRRMLEELVQELEVADLVEFVDRYVDDEELFDLVRASDLVVVPYDNHDQMSSGVITEAIGLGRPVVSTRFPYSEEMLGSGAGMVVDHSWQTMADAIRHLFEDPVAYRRAAAAASGLSGELGWAAVAAEYSRLIHGMTPAMATA